MSSKTPVSVVVITKNEAHNITDCLECVHGWADEIIVVDSKSEDNTVELAEKFADKVLIRPMDIEGIHRNWSYDQARNDWVLSVDADERVTPELRDEIDQTLLDPRANVYTIPRKNFIGDYWLQYGGQYPSAQLRLFSKSKSEFRYEEVEVHPRAFFQKPQSQLTSHVIHYSYRDFTNFLDKLNSQSSLEAKKWFRTGRKVTFFTAFRRYVDRFFRTYRRKKSHKDGFHGFMVAFFASLYQIISYSKYWEYKTGKGCATHSEQPSPEIVPYDGDRPKLTVIVMTKNEEENITDCLRSLEGWPDEILVVDDESTDQTRVLAERYARVEAHKWDNEGVHRNWCIHAAKNDWIMFMDADEMITKELREEITEELKKGEFDSYSPALKTFIGKTWVKHGGWYPANKLRILDRRKQWFKEEGIHPTPANFVTCKRLKHDLYHKGYPNFTHFVKTLNHQTSGEAKKWIYENRKVTRRGIMWKARLRFLKTYISKGGFRDGFVGFMVSYFAYLYQVMSYAKYWEIKYLDAEKK